MTAPLILTSGEPAGVAPEITAAAWRALRAEPTAAFALLGDAAYWQARNPGLAIAEIASPAGVGVQVELRGLLNAVPGGVNHVLGGAHGG